MARKSETVLIDNTASRDAGKVFIITEMPALEGAELANELNGMAGRAENLAIPDDVVLMGCAGLATLGMPLLAASGRECYVKVRDELLKNVQISISHEGKEIVRKVNVSLDIEEVDTINLIVDKSFEINFAFLKLGGE